MRCQNYFLINVYDRERKIILVFKESTREFTAACRVGDAELKTVNFGDMSAIENNDISEKINEYKL